MKQKLILVALAVIACVGSTLLCAFAEQPDVSAKLENVAQAVASSIEVFPKKAHFRYLDDRQKFGVQIVLPDGSTQDVTSEVQWQADELPLSLDETSFGPVASANPQQGRLLGRWKNRSIEVPFEIQTDDLQRELTFRNDILPVLTKTGCNTGKCHGSASGKDGFRLSLYGFDPEGDFYRITRELSGRRINLARPESCLMVNKSIGEVPHTGGSPMQPGDS